MMNVFQVVVFVLCISLIGNSCKSAYRDSDGRHEVSSGLNDGRPHGAPNGLDNNGFRCYANSVLQLLAACFPDEIKKIPPFGSGDQREQIRIDLCTVVDHINAKEKRSTSDQRVMNAVKRLTFQLCPKSKVGGCVVEFASRLNRELEFLSDSSQMFLFCSETLSYKDHQGVTLESISPSGQGHLSILSEPSITFFTRLFPDSVRGLNFSKDFEGYWKLTEDQKWQFLNSLEGTQNVWDGIPMPDRYSRVTFTKLQKK